MKLFLLAFLVPVFAMADESPYQCGSAADAERAVKQEWHLDPSDHYTVTIKSEDEALNGGKIVYRRILVGVKSVHGAGTDKVVVNYTIIKSFDGPHNGDYCDRYSIEAFDTLCSRRPELGICKE